MAVKSICKQFSNVPHLLKGFKQASIIYIERVKEIDRQRKRDGRREKNKESEIKKRRKKESDRLRDRQIERESERKKEKFIALNSIR